MSINSALDTVPRPPVTAHGVPEFGVSVAHIWAISVWPAWWLESALLPQVRYDDVQADSSRRDRYIPQYLVRFHVSLKRQAQLHLSFHGCIHKPVDARFPPHCPFRQTVPGSSSDFFLLSDFWSFQRPLSSAPHRHTGKKICTIFALDHLCVHYLG